MIVLDENGKGGTSRLSPIRARPLSEDVLNRLRTAIAVGELRPGDHLVEVDVARMLGVSRGPVRQALARLERENLVRVELNRGAVVRQLTDGDLEEVYELRRVLERLAIEHAIRNATDEDLKEMDAVIDEIARAVEEDGAERVAELDIAFHECIYRAARRERLHAWWSDLRPQVYVFLLTRNIVIDDYRAIAVREHRELRDLIAGDDVAAGREAIETHLVGAYERLLKARSDQRAAMGDRADDD